MRRRGGNEALVERCCERSHSGKYTFTRAGIECLEGLDLARPGGANGGCAEHNP